MQGTRVRALVWEDPTCCGATGSVSHSYWACASGACAPQQERPAHRDEEGPPLAVTRESPPTETKTQHSNQSINQSMDHHVFKIKRRDWGWRALHCSSVRWCMQHWDGNPGDRGGNGDKGGWAEVITADEVSKNECSHVYTGSSTCAPGSQLGWWQELRQTGRPVGQIPKSSMN